MVVGGGGEYVYRMSDVGGKGATGVYVCVCVCV